MDDIKLWTLLDGNGGFYYHNNTQNKNSIWSHQLWIGQQLEDQRKLGELTVQGIFCRAFFRNGDKVEVVVEPLEDGSYYAYALHRPIDHRLWLYPWAMKGTKANNDKNYSKNQLILLVFLGCFFMLII